MWLYTETGFVSAVANKDNENLIVRARDRVSLGGLSSLTGNEIEVGQGTDYPYRLSCTKEIFNAWASEHILNISYPNFKNRIYETRGPRFAQVLSEVWFSMLEVENIVPQSKKARNTKTNNRKKVKK